jgi:hypothetical protein
MIRPLRAAFGESCPRWLAVGFFVTGFRLLRSAASELSVLEESTFHLVDLISGLGLDTSFFNLVDVVWILLTGSWVAFCFAGCELLLVSLLLPHLDNTREAPLLAF